MKISSPTTVAAIILDQIKTLDRMALFAYGAKQFIAYHNGVRFKVHGQKCGHAFVKITLTPEDLYEVHVFKLRKRKSGETAIIDIEKTDGIYCENLVDCLDRIIEGR